MLRLEITRLGQDRKGRCTVDRNDLSSLVVLGCWGWCCGVKVIHVGKFCVPCVMCNASFETSSLAVKKI